MIYYIQGQSKDPVIRKMEVGFRRSVTAYDGQARSFAKSCEAANVGYSAYYDAVSELP